MKENVIGFFNSDHYSAMMPRISDCCVVKTGNIKEKLQKRMLLFNMREAYKEFKNQNGQLKIGYTKFVQLKPKNVVVPGSPGTHVSCMCSLHENAKLLLQAVNHDKIPKDYKVVISSACCEFPSK